ncbi:MAG: DUF885 domain-containing protein [Verrucomicrobiota bacterium]
MRLITTLTLLSVTLLTSAHATPEWVNKSNANALGLLQALGTFSPEMASSYGLSQYDTLVSDLNPNVSERSRAALTKIKTELEAKLAIETDARVKQDLQIMIDATTLRIEGSLLHEKHFLPYESAGKAIFSGEFGLLNDQVAVSRHAAAVTRLQRYTGQLPGTTALTELAKARFEEKLSDPSLQGPFLAEVQQDIPDTLRFASGIRKLFIKQHIDQAPGAQAALAALDVQLKDYADWIKRVVLAHSRSNFVQPEEVYAHDLKRVGLSIPPRELISKAQLAYSEIRNELDVLAPLVAASHGWSETSYQDVIHHLKRDQLAPEQTEAFYKNEVIPHIEALIRKNHVATLPDRPMAMRVASEAESAVQPAPHMQPPPLLNNHGEQGAFVLPLGNPSAKGDASDKYDDFTFKAGAWTLTAHEGRPGHELQFARMVEGGVSLARSIFAFNSVNVEGWALYSEAEMVPYEPLDGQLIALQLRLLRAVRAFADPMLNLGLMTKEHAHDILINDVCLSEGFAREEVDRFTFRMPGQATSYFYGYTRLMQLQASTRITLGSKFDRLAFNDFLVNQGLLPPDLLASAVQTEFIPQQLAR